MDAVSLERWRVFCWVLLLLIGIIGGGNEFDWWRIDGSSVTTDPDKLGIIRLVVRAWFIWALVLWGVQELIKEKLLPEANKKAAAERTAREERERQQKVAAAAERQERQQSAREKAVTIARADYPQHIDFDALGERGWWDDDYGSEMITAYLDPPEVVLQYTVPGSEDDAEIRLYARERVLAAETDDEVRDHIKEVLHDREQSAAAKRRAEEEARMEAEEAAAEEEEKREQERRLAEQKVIRIDDRLK